MFSFLVKKILYGSLVMLGVIVLVFILFQGFGDPARLAIGQSGDSATIQNIRHELALDQPKWKQFTQYLNDVSPISVQTQEDISTKKLRGYFVHIGTKSTLGIKLPNLRSSYQSHKPVVEMLGEAMPGTLLLAFAAMSIATIIGILLGVVAATHQNTWIDGTSIFTSILGISAPSFFIGILIAYVFGFVLSDYTGLSITGSLYVYGIDGKDLQLKNLILPAFTLGIRPLAVIAQLTRSSMLDVFSQNYIRTAYAKGLTSKRVTYKHALPNALNPVITTVTGWFAELLSGAFFVEYIFGWKGIGKVTVDALDNLDFPVVMGSVLVTAGIFVIVNILADILYATLDPRIEIT